VDGPYVCDDVTHDGPFVDHDHDSDRASMPRGDTFVSAFGPRTTALRMHAMYSKVCAAGAAASRGKTCDFVDDLQHALMSRGQRPLLP
jgi:hypothetical protein